jgi:hypothetical protein
LNYDCGSAIALDQAALFKGRTMPRARLKKLTIPSGADTHHAQEETEDEDKTERKAAWDKARAACPLPGSSASGSRESGSNGDARQIARAYGCNSRCLKTFIGNHPCGRGHLLRNTEHLQCAKCGKMSASNKASADTKREAKLPMMLRLRLR